MTLSCTINYKTQSITIKNHQDLLPPSHLHSAQRCPENSCDVQKAVSLNIAALLITTVGSTGSTDPVVNRKELDKR